MRTLQVPAHARGIFNILLRGTVDQNRRKKRPFYNCYFVVQIFVVQRSENIDWEDSDWEDSDWDHSRGQTKKKEPENPEEDALEVDHLPEPGKSL